MAVMAPNQPLFTILVRYSVEPANQAALVETLKRSAPTFARFPGFISLTMHRALEGDQVLVYLQWRSRADSDACMTDPIWLSAGQELMTEFITTGKATMAVNAYEVVAQIEA